MGRRIRYDLDLFLALNEEYAAKKVNKAAPPISSTKRRRQYKERTAGTIDDMLQPHFDIRGKRVLDFGCGRGDLCVVLAERFGCTATGVDINEYEEWSAIETPGVQLRVLDLCEEDDARQLTGRIDAIVSNSVLEHVAHPYAALRGMRTVLGGEGVISLKINLYRGPLASHRYRDVYFPWPHLLFTDEVFEQFYEHIGRAPKGAAWVNKLTHLHYRDHFARLELEVVRETFNTSPIDEEFYARFEDVLSRYPRTDLERNFLNVILRPARKRRWSPFARR